MNMRPEKPKLIPAGDTTTTQADVMHLVTMLKMELSLLQAPGSAPHASAEERANARWLYERLVDFCGMQFKRPLRGSIEFISGGPNGSAFHGHPGWYYKAPETADGKPIAGAAYNWYGPFSTHKEAIAARDRDHPKTIVAQAFKMLDAVLEG